MENAFVCWHCCINEIFSIDDILGIRSYAYMQSVLLQMDRCAVASNQLNVYLFIRYCQFVDVELQ